MREVQSLDGQRKKSEASWSWKTMKFIGIIVLWDLKRVKKEQHWDSPVKAFMARDIITIDPGCSAIGCRPNND